MRIPDHRNIDDDEDVPQLPTEVPSAPNRDLGTGGTKEVDSPKNTDDLGEEIVPEPPD
jgi:hypothetical protein